MRAPDQRRDGRRIICFLLFGAAGQGGRPLGSPSPWPGDGRARDNGSGHPKRFGRPEKKVNTLGEHRRIVGGRVGGPTPPARPSTGADATTARNVRGSTTGTPLSGTPTLRLTAPAAPSRARPRRSPPRSSRAGR